MTLAVLGLPWPCLAQTDQLMIPRGEVVERLTAASDTSQHYALYVPSSYSTDNPPPVLFLMDPRGRAALPMGLFREAAERHGYLVMSSHETLSDEDTAFTVNQRALNAMIQDAQLRFTVDTRRMVLAGFSGTAHFAWYAASELDGHIAGVIGAGDGMPPEDPPIAAAKNMNRPFSYYGIAGTGDFNYDLAWRRDRELDQGSVPHRFSEFDGPHSWMPKDLAEEAIDWLQLRAMDEGLVSPDSVWVWKQFERRLARAREAEVADQPARAWRLYREIGQDFSGLMSGTPEMETVHQTTRELAGSSEVQRAERRKLAMSNEFDDYRGLLYRFFQDYARSPLMTHERAVERLQLDQLLDARSSPDADRAALARRKLASAAGHTGFYQPREYLDEGDFARAAGLLRLALLINPQAPNLCYSMARAQAGLGRTETALEALECALERGFVSLSTLNQDPLLESLRGNQQFEQLIARYLNESDAGQ